MVQIKTCSFEFETRGGSVLFKSVLSVDTVSPFVRLL